MDHAARDVMNQWKDIIFCFGESDEYSFLFRRSTNLYNRRQAKILTAVVSQFTASYAFRWNDYFPETPLAYPPTFDARLTLYPSKQEVRDYFAWRQADTHVNNLYNTAFWALVEHGGKTTTQAHETLRGTNSSQKNEILFSRFDINYNKLSARFRKGSVLVRMQEAEGDNPSDTAIPLTPQGDENCDSPLQHRRTVDAIRRDVQTLHDDIIRDEFWDKRPTLLHN